MPCSDSATLTPNPAPFPPATPPAIAAAPGHPSPAGDPNWEPLGPIRSALASAFWGIVTPHEGKKRKLIVGVCILLVVCKLRGSSILDKLHWLMGGCCCGEREGKGSSGGLASQEHKPCPLDSFADWKKQLFDDLTKPLLTTSVHSDFPRIARELVVGVDPGETLLVTGTGAPSTHQKITPEEGNARQRRVANRLIEICAICGETDLEEQVKSTWEQYLTEDSFDLSQGMKAIFKECIPEESTTAAVLKCLGQGIVFTPLSRMRFLTYIPGYCERLQDTGIWKMHIFRSSDAVVVSHIRTESADADGKIRNLFDFTWQCQIRVCTGQNCDSPRGGPPTSGRSPSPGRNSAPQGQSTLYDSSIRLGHVNLKTKRADLNENVVNKMRQYWPEVVVAHS